MTVEELLTPIVDEIVERISERVKELATPREPKYYTRNEVCKLLGITGPTLWKHTKSGKLQSQKIGRRVLYDAWQIDSIIKSGISSLSKI